MCAYSRSLIPQAGEPLFHFLHKQCSLSSFLSSFLGDCLGFRLVWGFVFFVTGSCSKEVLYFSVP